MIGRRGERGSVISVLAARHDDDESDTYISICVHFNICLRMYYEALCIHTSR